MRHPDCVFCFLFQLTITANKYTALSFPWFLPSSKLRPFLGNLQPQATGGCFLSQKMSFDTDAYIKYWPYAITRDVIDAKISMTFSAITQWKARMLFCLRIVEIPALANQIALFALQRTTQKQVKQRPHFHNYSVKSRDISTFST